MKQVSLLVWVTQLGISVALPPVGLILLAVWLRNHRNWGNWVIWVGIGLGIYCAIYGLIHSLKTLGRLTKESKEEAPPIAFNDHI